jgi:MFS family permease
VSTPTSIAAGTAVPRKAAIASFLGSSVEYYDFFIYGTAAALVFGKVFFPATDSSVGTLLAFATFGVAFVVRPIGAVIIGHFGDKVGRKRMMMLTLSVMGAATVVIGLLPDYDTIGVWAPILLVLCRALQGFSAAGEQTGAGTLTLEHAPDDRRAFFTSWMLVGNQTGVILATLAFVPVALLPEDQLLSWGWRVPFLLGVLPFAVAWTVRRSLPEAEAFTEVEQAGEEKRIPILSVLRDKWKDLLRVICASSITMVNTIASVYGLSYATSHGVSRSTMLWVVVIGAAASLATIPLYGMLSDRFGRKPVYVGGAVASGLAIYPYFLGITSGDIALVIGASILLTAVAYSATNAIYTAFFCEMFPASIRYSGVAFGTQIGFLSMGITPLVGAAIDGPGDFGWLPVAVFTSCFCAVAAVAALTARETYRTPTAELGRS